MSLDTEVSVNMLNKTKITPPIGGCLLITKLKMQCSLTNSECIYFLTKNCSKNEWPTPARIRNLIQFYPTEISAVAEYYFLCTQCGMSSAVPTTMQSIGYQLLPYT